MPIVTLYFKVSNIDAAFINVFRSGEPRFRVDACLMFRKALPGAYVKDVEVGPGTARLQDA